MGQLKALSYARSILNLCKYVGDFLFVFSAADLFQFGTIGGDSITQRERTMGGCEKVPLDNRQAWGHNGPNVCRRTLRAFTWGRRIAMADIGHGFGEQLAALLTPGQHERMALVREHIQRQHEVEVASLLRPSVKVALQDVSADTAER